jgi:hypothetical protein
VRVHVTSKRRERRLGIRVFCRFPGAPAVSPSRRTVQASYLHRLRDGTGTYSDAWLKFNSLGGKMPAGKHGQLKNLQSKLYFSVKLTQRQYRILAL